MIVPKGQGSLIFMSGLLRPDEGEPVIVVNETGPSPVVLICEHAGKVIPKSLGSLGLPPEELTRHIAWDIGAEAVARGLA
jgi:predicted N-formylglutamate amidohydrolase